MSSFALTALAGMSSSALDATFTLTTSQTGEATVRFGNGEHGAALPTGPGAMSQAAYAVGGGASGNAAAPQLGDRPLLHSGFGEIGLLGEGGRFGGSLMQQGRVQTDADRNEASEANEVLVAFERGQMRNPIVTAPLWNPADKPPASVGAADAVHAHLPSGSSHLDSTSEMGETESLRLQMAMDRLSKMMSTLSNLLQRIGATDAAITQNIK